MNDNVPDISLIDCTTFTPGSGLYIDPIKLLQYLHERAILLAERTAKPRLDMTTTELLRGHRQEILAFETELKKVIKNAPTES